MLSSPGIGSGLDVNSIISQLMAIEQRPLITLQARKTNLDAQISSYGKIKSALSKLQESATTLKDSSTYKVFSATSSDKTIFTATADSTAAVESHTIEITNLATKHRLSSVAFTNSSTEVGTGTLTLSNGSDSFVLTIDSSNDTLAQIRDEINSSTANTGIAASIVTVTAGAHLVLTAKGTGVSEAIQVTVSGDGDGNDTDTNGLSRLVYETSGTQNLSEEDAAVDAVLKIDGLSLTSSSNTISSAITGVTVNLVAAGTATLDLAKDFSSIENNMSSFAKDYNALITLLKDLRNEGLSGENLLLSIESGIRQIYSDKITGNISYVTDLGFSFDKNGVLSFDGSKLTTELTNDAAAVENLFTNSNQGFAVKIHAFLEDYVKTEGLIDTKTDSLSSTIKGIDDRIINLDFRLQKTEDRLVAQYSALDGLMSNLLATSSFLTQQLDNLLILTSGSLDKK